MHSFGWLFLSYIYNLYVAEGTKDIICRQILESNAKSSSDYTPKWFSTRRGNIVSKELGENS
jgi:hypothetical protein